jgi:hypothetical protein
LMATPRASSGVSWTLLTMIASSLRQAQRVSENSSEHKARNKLRYSVLRTKY